MIPHNTGPPDWNLGPSDLVDLLVVASVASLILWSAYLALATSTDSNFRPPVPQREVFQIAHVDQDWDRSPTTVRLQL